MSTPISKLCADIADLHSQLQEIAVAASIASAGGRCRVPVKRIREARVFLKMARGYLAYAQSEVGAAFLKRMSITSQIYDKAVRNEEQNLQEIRRRKGASFASLVTAIRETTDAEELHDLVSPFPRALISEAIWEAVQSGLSEAHRYETDAVRLKKYASDLVEMRSALLNSAAPNTQSVPKLKLVGAA